MCSEQRLRDDLAISELKVYNLIYVFMLVYLQVQQVNIKCEL